MPSLQSAIKKIASPKLAPLGFAYSGQPDPGSWAFSRNQDGVRQDIVILKSNHEDHALRVEFSTSAEPIALAVEHLMPPDQRQAWFYYKDDSLEDVLNKLVTLSFHYGLPYLQVYSRPIVLPPVAVARHLLECAAERGQDLADQLGTGWATPEGMIALEEYVLQQPLDASMGDWEPLLNASAFFGQAMLSICGGDWAWFDQSSMPILKDVGPKSCRVYPVLSVANFWTRRDDRNRLTTVFENIKKMVGC